MDFLRVRNWDKWQSYRKDRGQPPWIKVWRCLLTDWEFAQLSDAEKGHLVAIWLLAAERNGRVPADPLAIQKFCGLDTKPDLDKFLSLQFLETIKKRRRRGDVTQAPSWRHGDAPDQDKETETETETETEERQRQSKTDPTVVPTEQPPDQGSRGVATRARARPRGNGSAGSICWESYAQAYERRYGVPPTRNARVNSLMVQLVQRLGAEEAPQVAAYYCQHGGAYYLQRGHAVECLVRDAEKLRTEWATGRRITSTQARQEDRRQHTGEQAARLKREYEREDNDGES